MRFKVDSTSQRILRRAYSNKKKWSNKNKEGSRISIEIKKKHWMKGRDKQKIRLNIAHFCTSLKINRSKGLSFTKTYQKKYMCSSQK